MRTSIVLIVVACWTFLAFAAAEEKKIVCYLGSWAVYRPKPGKYEIEDINTDLCTHLIYTFVGLDKDKVNVLDPWQDLPSGKNGFKRFNDLRKKNPSIKTLVAIGGWNEASAQYSRMVANSTLRANFIENVISFIKEHDFQGLDFDWEYPSQRGGKQEDVKNFIIFLKEIREAFDRENLIITAAVGAAEFSASKSYDIAELSKYLHFINLMAYDFHGAWDTKTGLHAPLFPGKDEIGTVAAKFTVNAAVKYWLSHGAPAEKLILGVPTYGRSFTLANRNGTAIGDAIIGPGKAGPYTREPGVLGYNEICDFQLQEAWTVIFDEERRAPYAFIRDQWVSYDNAQSMKEKAEYIKKLGLGGAMIWSLESDDFKGKCDDEYLLIKTLNKVLREN